MPSCKKSKTRLPEVQAQTSDAAQLRATLERTQADMLSVLREVEQAMVLSNTQSSDQTNQTIERTQAELIGVLRGVEQTLTVSDMTSTHMQAQMIGVLREVEYTMAGTIAHAGVQTIQALWATAGAITGVTYTMSNGMIYAEYQTANGMIAAQYDASGRLVTTEHYIGGVLQGSINNTTNTVGGWSTPSITCKSISLGRSQVCGIRPGTVIPNSSMSCGRRLGWPTMKLPFLPTPCITWKPSMPSCPAPSGS